MNTEIARIPSVSELVEEYTEKAMAAEQAVADFEQAVKDIEFASTVKGTYGNGLFYRGTPSVSVRDVIESLKISAWRRAYNLMKIDILATPREKKRFEELFAKPKDFTMSDIIETFGDYVKDPFHSMLRSFAEVFSDLDPSYKSHSKVKIGVKGLPKRIIIQNVKSYSYGKDRFEAMLNALAAYQGKPLAEWKEIYRVINTLEKAGTFDWSNGLEVDGQTMPARGVTLKYFKNGNLHVAFNPDTLLDINRALAEFYGDVLPDAETKDAKRRESTSVSKDLAYYPTPKSVAETVVAAANIADDHVVLEPSCGCGRIMDAVKAGGAHNVLGVEYHVGRGKEAESKGHAVIFGNFLEKELDQAFDRVVMNPPFVGRHYVKHVRHALKFLKPGGVLVTILPATAHYDHKELKGDWYDLPVASFAESGTNIPTGYMIIRKPRD